MGDSGSATGTGGNSTTTNLFGFKRLLNGGLLETLDGVDTINIVGVIIGIFVDIFVGGWGSKVGLLDNERIVGERGLY